MYRLLQATASNSNGVTHLVESASLQTCGTTLALLADVRATAGGRSRVLLLGGQALRDTAHAAGLTDASRLGVPHGRAIYGLPGLRHRLRVSGDVERFVCWSSGALLAARLLRPNVPRVLAVTQPLNADDRRALRWCFTLPWPRPAGGALTRVATLGEAMRDHLLSTGLEAWADRIDALPLTGCALPPTDDADASRAAVRRRWNLPDEATKVVTLLADPPACDDAQPAILAAALARAALLATEWLGEVRLAIHPDHQNRLRAESVFAQLDRNFQVIREPALAEPWRVLPACDAAIAMGPLAGGLSVGLAQAAGVPVVGEPTPGVRAWLEHDRSGLLARDSRPRSLAHCLTRLLRQRDLSRRLAAGARSAAGQRAGALAVWAEHLEGPASTVPQEAVPFDFQTEQHI